jgi:hypothetical protein
MYIESYNKCPNCGLLLYETPQNTTTTTVISDGKTYCSSWCVEWEADRKKRRQGTASA